MDHVDDDDFILRRVVENQIDRRGEEVKIQSAGFQNLVAENMSADLLSVLTENDLDAVTLVEDFPGFALVKIRVGDLRELGQEVLRDPLPNNPSHVHVAGPKSKSTKRKIAKLASANIIHDPA